jgi:8-oxo-dGTP pyrophosphatase MutT (NUDIX family)
MDGVLHRRAARVICLDDRERILLLSWRDPCTGEVLWEPPGGGLERGESDLEAAQRELHEETGLRGSLDDSWAVEVKRDFCWNGKRFVGPERFYGLDVGQAIAAQPACLTETETGALLGSSWFSSDEIKALRERVEPPDLPAVVSALLAMRRTQRE